MKFYFIILSLLLFLSCNKDDSNYYSPDDEQVEILPTIHENNNKSVNTRATDPFIALDGRLNFVSRYYKWNSSSDANHHYSLETPNNISNFKYIANGATRSFFGSNYVYEGISFYTYKKEQVPILGYAGEVELRSVYLPESNNTRLYTLKTGEVDPYKNYSLKSHLGYIIDKDKSDTYGLVAIREYYSQKEKDYFYISDDFNAYNMGNQSGNYTLSQIIGYTFQSYRVYPYYYNYFHVATDSSTFPNDLNKYGKAQMILKFNTEIISHSGSPSGQKTNVASELMNLTKVDSYIVFIPPSRDVLSSELIIYYSDSNYKRQMISLGNFYFSNDFPNGSDISFVRSTESCSFKVNIRRNAVNLWNIYVTGV